MCVCVCVYGRPAENREQIRIVPNDNDDDDDDEDEVCRAFVSPRAAATGRSLSTRAAASKDRNARFINYGPGSLVPDVIYIGSPVRDRAAKTRVLLRLPTHDVCRTAQPDVRCTVIDTPWSLLLVKRLRSTVRIYLTVSGVVFLFFFSSARLELRAERRHGKSGRERFRYGNIRDSVKIARRAYRAKAAIREKGARCLCYSGCASEGVKEEFSDSSGAAEPCRKVRMEQDGRMDERAPQPR